MISSLLWLGILVVVKAVGYDNPALTGGSLLTNVLHTIPLGEREPINIIISNESSPRVLKESMNDGGMYNFLMSVNYGPECLGLHMGDVQTADLGDGQGNQTQKAILRYMYFGDPYLGTCLETIFGGTHIRVFKQETSGAWFLSASMEQDMYYNHNIAINGYDIGRDEVSGNATGTSIDPSYLSNGRSISGVMRYGGWSYNTTVEYVSGLFSLNRTKINHYPEVQLVGQNVTDGFTAVWTVKVLED
ncbi:hypothetical protein TREMEDRAFT_32868 [Tremella mesenterica DSM 1558]|uniref:uncharacterized protein n=1 Tax=Tremella mesenterica (strain ATCC 24925 / CBS 8224 / DSM 1558 / NBRC 9311 / NRRL Y-6157 / RJB 2259-6 / UBC 559-6) TaxID=578456 RepID=UPI0003F48DAC|nr:uncharacterized protein TREMEDRAFT_32868 [Tremella mesenterica DSM 1558]EIW67857.1 hypothetical protein TREMEDRAFT_32868 [Tremella mesenterica DSM 1558]